MILTVDVGNSATEFGFFENNVLTSKFRVVTEKQKTKDEYLVTINSLLSVHGIDKNRVKGAVISSVVPELNVGMTNAVKVLFGVEAVILKPGTKTGIKVITDNPAEVGSDLVAGVVGALQYKKETFVVVDLGTATTFTIVDNYNTIKGVSIMAGIRLSVEALVGHTSQLKTFELKTPTSVIGTNTTESLQSGAVFGHAGMVDGIVKRIEKELNKKVDIIITGGLSDLITPHLSGDVIANKNLLLEGLRDIYEKNK